MPISQARSAPLSRRVGGQPQVRQIAIDIESLRPEHCLQHDMHDRNGMLLLAAGSVITPGFLDRLRERAIRHVRVHAAELRGADSPHGTDSSEEVRRIENRQARAVVDGVPFINNHGPILRGQLTVHGVNGFSTRLTGELIAHAETTTRAAESLMRDLVRGQERAASPLVSAVSQIVDHLIADRDCVLGCSVPIRGASDLAVHSLKMARLSVALGSELGLNRENCVRLGISALLHDWGLLKVSPRTRLRRTRPTRLEQLEWQRHPGYSVDLIERLKGLPTLVSLLSHQVHERLDGTGYPNGRSGNRIHFLARILHVAHDYVRLTTPLPWRPAHTPYVAMVTILGQADGRCDDPRVVRALVRTLGLYPVGSRVRLSDGTTARVLRPNTVEPLRPIVECLETGDVQDLSQESRSIVMAEADPDTVQLTQLPYLERLARIDQAQPIEGPHFSRRSSLAAHRGNRQTQRHDGLARS
ncbi:MAG: HD domain-containing protein [Planctomycetaceae bacterium]|nr:HD domain-containing protein [Planctomycetaceae bacterium]